MSFAGQRIVRIATASVASPCSSRLIAPLGAPSTWSTSWTAATWGTSALPGVSAPEAGIRLGIDSATGVAFVDPEVVAGNMWTPAEARRFAADLLRATDVLDPSPRSDRAICPSWCESHTQIDEADSAAGFIHEHQVTVGEVSLVLCAASFQPDADNAGESKATWYVDMLPEYQWLDGQAVLDYAEALRQAYELGSPQSGDPWRRAVRQAGCITQEVPAL